MKEKKRSHAPPSLAEEQTLRNKGYAFIAGMDEAGRGALAGPVVAAVVILPDSIAFPSLRDVRDSKELTPAKREYLYDAVRKEAVAVGIGIVPTPVNDRINILEATREAMEAAIMDIPMKPDFLLLEALTIPRLPLPQKGIIRGDRLCLSIACASIIAKVARDRLMIEMDKSYPGYGMAKHKGYGTKQHIDCLRKHGPCPIHRRSFSPVNGIQLSL